MFHWIKSFWKFALRSFSQCICWPMTIFSLYFGGMFISNATLVEFLVDRPHWNKVTTHENQAKVCINKATPYKNKVTSGPWIYRNNSRNNNATIQENKATTLKKSCTSLKGSKIKAMLQENEVTTHKNKPTTNAINTMLYWNKATTLENKAMLHWIKAHY